MLYKLSATKSVSMPDFVHPPDNLIFYYNVVSDLLPPSRDLRTTSGVYGVEVTSSVATRPPPQVSLSKYLVRRNVFGLLLSTWMWLLAATLDTYTSLNTIKCATNSSLNTSGTLVCRDCRLRTARLGRQKKTCWLYEHEKKKNSPSCCCLST